MDKDKLLAELKSGRKNFSGEIFDFDFGGVASKESVSMGACDLRNCDFRNAKVQKLVFAKANLQGANFEGCDLERTNFNEADMSNANLRNVRCSQTSFQKTILVGADFSGAILSGQMTNADCSDASFVKSQLMHASMEGAVLTRANFTGSIMKSGYWGALSSTSAELANFSGADISGLVLRNANLRFANFAGANLQKCSFEGANLQGANLSGANLSNSNFNNADIRDSNLTGCKFDGILLTGAQVSEGSLPEKVELIHALLNGYVFSAPGADLSFANFSGLKVDGLNLKGANLKNTNFANCSLRYSNLAAAQLCQASIRRSDFTDAELNGADLSKTFIENCHFTNADLSNTTFTGASCIESTFANATLKGARELRGLNLKPSALKGAILSGSDLDVTSVDADDEGTIFDRSLVRVLEAKVDGLLHYSESEYPYEIRFWSKECQGEFTTEAFLQSIGHLHKLDAELIFDPTSPARKGDTKFVEMVDLYSALLETVVDDLRDYELYLLGYKADPEPAMNCLIFLAKTREGHYFGFAPTYERYGGHSIESEVQVPVRDLDAELLLKEKALLEKVEKAISGSAKKLSGVKQISWFLADSREEAIEALLLLTKSISVEQGFRRTFSEDTHSEGNDADDDRWQEAIRLFNANLTEFKSYVLRSSTHDIYSWGRTKSGNWIGIQTQVVWT